ncbi:hypothetical protein GTO91_07390 [Heliobacterium undosum]|uniref:Copper amine oxidase-like N-terminal domain-containing protein n=1 Tax=Heliomicrobium undosum TaxID=121734 RepID=A0A845L344_9FIRM|nr:copper amine oxidase N-terminal domain-containing protein [Heliomicrobium undosum]MZP29529.1 hypothetical protein [Heliomicrobium undosum]
MFKRSKKTISMLVSGLLLLAPMVSTPVAAYASSSFASVKTDIAEPGGVINSRIMIEVPQGAMAAGSTATFRMRLPINSDFQRDGAGAIVAGANVSVEIPATYDNTVPNQFVDNTGNMTAPANLTDKVYADGTTTDDGSSTWVKTVKIGQEYEFSVKQNGAGKGIMYINLNKVKIPSGQSGDFKAIFEAQGGSIFSNGEVVVATVGTGTAAVTLDDVKSISSVGGAIDVIRVKEDRPGALSAASDSVKLKLPQGFTWDITNAKANTVWGNLTYTNPGTKDSLSATEDGGRTLKMTVTGKSTSASYINLTGLAVNVDESVAKTGDITVSTNLTPSTLVLGKYGEFGSSVNAFGDAPNRLAGRNDNELGKVVIEEDMAGSLVVGRTIVLTIPENTKWRTYPSIDSANSDAHGLVLGAWTAVGTDGRTIKAQVTTASSGDPAKVVFEKGSVDVAANFSGDLKVDVTGTAGVAGSLVLAKVAAPITATVSASPELKIGVAGQAAGELILTEAKAEAIMGESKALQIHLPLGVDFSSTPKFEVVEGDLVLNADSATTGTDSNDNTKFAKVTIKSTSSVPSKIKVSGIKLTVDRTVPEGNITFKVKGAAVNETSGFTSSTIASIANGKVVTPAPEGAVIHTVFKINETKYTVNGVEKTMDIAPYLENSRTYLPVRYVGEILGINSGNMIWDGANQTATLIKGDKVVQMKMGSKTLLVNGAAITMDVAPQIVQPGRVMLPVGWLLNIFGATGSFDPATQTVTIN